MYINANIFYHDNMCIINNLYEIDCQDQSSFSSWQCALNHWPFPRSGPSSPSAGMETIGAARQSSPALAPRRFRKNRIWIPIAETKTWKDGQSSAYKSNLKIRFIQLSKNSRLVGAFILAPENWMTNISAGGFGGFFSAFRTWNTVALFLSRVRTASIWLLAPTLCISSTKQQQGERCTIYPP